MQIDLKYCIHKRHSHFLPPTLQLLTTPMFCPDVMLECGSRNANLLNFHRCLLVRLRVPWPLFVLGFRSFT